MSKILITGSSGFFGKDSIEFLLSKGYEAKNIFALVRDASKGVEFSNKGVNVVVGDYDNKESLVKAFTGIDKILFISSNDIEKRGQQHLNVVESAKQVGGIKQIVYTSFYKNEEIKESAVAFVEKDHAITEKLLKESGIVYTNLQNILYSDYVTEYYLGAQVLEKGIFYPAGDGVGNYVARKDMAEAAVNILLEQDISKHANKDYIISGVESYSFHDIAKILSETSGKTINYVSPDIETYKNVLASFGLPPFLIKMSEAFALAIQNNEFKSTKTDLPLLLGRNPKTLKQTLIETYLKK